MPILKATFLASATAPSEQQPPKRSVSSAFSFEGQICMVIPKTSYLRSLIRAAVTEESTPPLIATNTLGFIILIFAIFGYNKICLLGEGIFSGFLNF